MLSTLPLSLPEDAEAPTVIPEESTRLLAKKYNLAMLDENARLKRILDAMVQAERLRIQAEGERKAQAERERKAQAELRRQKVLNGFRLLYD